MNTSVIKSYVILVVCLATVAVAQERDNQKREILGNGISIGEIREYRKMFRVNQQPIDMVEGTKFMCAAPTTVYGPHYNPGVVYYVNEIARQGISTFSASREFPVGSIIVKEKQERKTEDTVQIVTVMKKIRAGHSEDSWEYKMYDAGNWAEIDASKLARRCIDCHRRYAANDYVSDTGMELLLRK